MSMQWDAHKALYNNTYTDFPFIGTVAEYRGWYIERIWSNETESYIVVVDWMGRMPSTQPTRFDLMALIRRHLEDRGFSCMDVRNASDQQVVRIARRHDTGHNLSYTNVFGWREVYR
jgi:hypothetical protein